MKCGAVEKMWGWETDRLSAMNSMTLRKFLSFPSLSFLNSSITFSSFYFGFS